MLDTWYHPHPMIRVFTQSPDMIADMIWIHLITLSNQCLQNLLTQGHDMKCCLRRRGDFHWLKPFAQSIIHHFYYSHTISPPRKSAMIWRHMIVDFKKSCYGWGFPQDCSCIFYRTLLFISYQRSYQLLANLEQLASSSFWRIFGGRKNVHVFFL